MRSEGTLMRFKLTPALLGDTGWLDNGWLDKAVKRNVTVRWAAFRPHGEGDPGCYTTATGNDRCRGCGRCEAAFYRRLVISG